MPRIDDLLIPCVFYVYPSKQDAIDNSEEGATGFFFGVDSEISPLRPHLYAVTNSHVISRNGMEEPVLRINTQNHQFDTIKTHRTNWRSHPDGDDVAICPVQIDHDIHNINFFDRKGIIDDEFMKEKNFGPGDDVMMIGRFRRYAGREKNLPTVRFGNIASMNEEPLYNDATQLMQESYIVEMRSMSGYSGSPVILFIPPNSFRLRDPDSEKPEVLKLELHQRLLGINWGHIIYTEKAKDQYGQELLIEMDSAMAGVVPISKLMDLIDNKEMIEMRKKKDEETKKKNDDSGIRTTSHTERS